MESLDIGTTSSVAKGNPQLGSSFNLKALCQSPV